jgi:DNA-directed RNA polymerase subunit H (RpoH/RPB5)
MKTHNQLLKELDVREQRLKQMVQEPDTYGKCSRCQKGEMVIVRTGPLYPEGIAYHLRCSHCGYEEVEPFD